MKLYSKTKPSAQRRYRSSGGCLLKNTTRIFGATKMTKQEFGTVLKLAQMHIYSRPLIALNKNYKDQNQLTITLFHLETQRSFALFHQVLMI